MNGCTEIIVPANLFRGIEAVGGNLQINHEKVVFRPHSLNFQKKELEIKMEEIQGVNKRRTWMIIPNGIDLKLKSGKNYKFVVTKRENIIELIERNI